MIMKSNKNISLKKNSMNLNKLFHKILFKVNYPPMEPISINILLKINLFMKDKYKMEKEKD
jgi:hypothetical protein